MREILFRGKAKFDGTKHKKGDWLFGDLNHVFDKCYIFDREDGGIDSTDCYEVDKETIGQFTGFKGKNERNVFEGDIIQSPNGQIESAYITFHDGAFFYTHIQSDEEVEHWGDSSEEIYHWAANRIAIKVIGNITDNPELLKK